jgi:hypothetical protein
MPGQADVGAVGLGCVVITGKACSSCFWRISSGLGKFGFPEVIWVIDGPLLPRDNGLIDTESM